MNNKFKKVDNISAYSGEKRFFVSIQKSDGTEEILTDSSLDPNDDIAVQRNILLRKNLKVIGNIELGKRREIINDASGHILHSKLSIENKNNNGKLIGFEFDKCQTTSPTSSIFLSPINPDKITHNNIEYNVNSFEPFNTNGKSWQFAFPYNINYNDDVFIQFYFFKTANNTNKFIEFEYNLSKLENNDQDLNFNKLQMKLSGGNTFDSGNFKCKIQLKEEDILNNKIMNLILRRNISPSSIDNCSNNIYLLGIKLEFKLNYFT